MIKKKAILQAEGNNFVVNVRPWPVILKTTGVKFSLFSLFPPNDDMLFMSALLIKASLCWDHDVSL